PLRTEEEAQVTLAKTRKSEVDGILAPRFLSLNIPGFILDAAQKHGLPTMFYGFFFVERGGVVAYYASDAQLGRAGRAPERQPPNGHEARRSTCRAADDVRASD